LVRDHTLFWNQNGVQQSRGIRQPIGIATSRVAQLRQLLFMYDFGDSDVISSCHIYASCFPAILSVKLC